MQIALEIDWENSGSWSDESAYVRELRWGRGMAQPGDAMAEVGRGTVVLDNRSGRFSPGRADGPLYGKLVPRRPVRVLARAADESWPVFVGVIEQIVPGAGRWQGQTVTLALADAVALLRQERAAAPHYETLRVNAALAWIVAQASGALATDLTGGEEALTHVGRTWLPESTTCWDAARDVAQSVHGRFWIARDGRATFRGREFFERAGEGTALEVGAGHDWPDETEQGLDVARVVNAVQVVTYPVETIAAEAVLWKATTVLRIPPESTRTIAMPFHDAQGQRCGAVEVATPAPGIDIRVTDTRDGTGYDYTGAVAFSYSVNVEATRATITLTSTATGPLYVNRLQIRGKPIVTYSPIVSEAVDDDSQAHYQKRAIVLDLPMQSDELFGAGLADYLVRRYSAPAVEARRLVFRDRDAVSGVSLLWLDLFDLVSVSDAVSGLAGARHWVTGLAVAIGPAGRTITLRLERADERAYWRLSVPGWSELNASARLGF